MGNQDLFIEEVTGRLMLLQHALFGLFVLLHGGSGKALKKGLEDDIEEQLGSIDNMEEVKSIQPVKSIKEVKSIQEVKHITPIEEAVALKAIKEFRLKNIIGDEDEVEDDDEIIDGGREWRAGMEDEEPLVEDPEDEMALEKLEESVEAIDAELEKDAEIEEMLEEEEEEEEEK